MKIESLNGLWIVTDGKKSLMVSDEEAETLRGMNPAEQVGTSLTSSDAVRYDTKVTTCNGTWC